MATDLARLTGPQWAALEAIKARVPDAGPKPVNVHKETLFTLERHGLIAATDTHLPFRRWRFALTVDGQAALNRARACRAEMAAINARHAAVAS